MSDGMSDMVWEMTQGRQAQRELDEPAALQKQVNGDHYKSMHIQPVEFIVANEIGFLEGNVIKYICRHQAKHGADDIKKAIHYCELILAMHYEGEDK